MALNSLKLGHCLNIVPFERLARKTRKQSIIMLLKRVLKTNKKEFCFQWAFHLLEGILKNFELCKILYFPYVTIFCNQTCSFTKYRMLFQAVVKYLPSSKF